MNPLRQQSKSPTRSMCRGDSFGVGKVSGLGKQNFPGLENCPVSGCVAYKGHPLQHTSKSGKRFLTAPAAKPGAEPKAGDAKLAASVQAGAATDPAVSKRKEMESYFADHTRSFERPKYAKSPAPNRTHAVLRKHGYRKVWDGNGETSWKHRDGHEVDHSAEGWHYNHAVKGWHKEGGSTEALEKHLTKLHGGKA